MNLLAMSLVSAAALSFSSCSNNDDLTGGGAGTQSQVDGFYMTLAIQTPTSNGTRTVPGADKTTSASTEEQTVTKGTFFLVDQKGSVAFSRYVDSSSKNEDEKWNGANESQTGTKLINIKVDQVVAGTTYKVYFLAGDNKVMRKQTLQHTYLQQHQSLRTHLQQIITLLCSTRMMQMLMVMDTPLFSPKIIRTRQTLQL